MTSSQPRVLVVDDDAGVLKSLELLLSDDCEVTVCDSPQHALGLATETRFDVIVTDYRMPHTALNASSRPPRDVGHFPALVELTGSDADPGGVFFDG